LKAVTMRVPRLRRRWVVLALVAALAFVGYRQLDTATWIYYYRVVDDHTLLVGTVSGPGASVRVTDVAETPTTVTITVTSFFFQLGPSTAMGVSYESVAKLIDPIGGRTVIDGSSGLSVQRATCPPPAYFAPVCP
jgi:hypothetical protein